VLGSQSEGGVLGTMRNSVAAERRVRAAAGCAWELGKWWRYGGMCWRGLRVRVCACRRSRNEVLGDGRARELTCCRGEMRAVVEAASPM